MNFFEHQRAAKSRTRMLVFLFAVAVLFIVIMVDLVLLFVVADQGRADGFADLLLRNAGLLLAGAFGTGLLIGLASLFRVYSLSDGGGKVARELGGTLVDADTRDLKRRQLRNVVEEMSIAAGIPVPEIYVLEKETGINAFAAGLTTSDAAIAVTRGLLDTMSREELQGVIAHEFSHVLNGDMRLNLRLMGVLFGILVIAIIGRKILHGASRVRSKNASGGVLIGVAVMVIGYAGLFFGRWIKAAVSRQREFLADASAVQFTRNPDSIGGALKKIAVYKGGTYLEEDTEEVGHMLFEEGASGFMFATHPPVLDRIRRIQPRFREAELEDVRRRLENRLAREERKAEKPAQEKKAAGWAGGLTDLAGNTDLERLIQAAVLVAAIPAGVREAAHSVEWAPALLLYTLLDRDPAVRSRQRERIAGRLGLETESQVAHLLNEQPQLPAEQRLPLFELAFPAIKRRPPEELDSLHALIGELVTADGQVDTFEYLLARLIQQHLKEAGDPASVRLSGSLRLASAGQAAGQTLAVLAGHGHREEVHAERAYILGLEVMGLPITQWEPVGDWAAVLDEALPTLNLLRPEEKQKFLEGIVACVMFDEHVETPELELLRVLCGAIHVPLPLLAGEEGN
jgi:Zn-dependent protease with chaperone function